MSTGWKLILAGTVFNVFWLLTVMGQSQYLWISGLILLIVWWLVPQSCLFALSLAIPGIVMDAALERFGIFTFADDIFPGWLIVLWLGFATFVWSTHEAIMKRSHAVIIVLGGVGGMLSYLAGERLGAVVMPFGMVITALVILSCWLVFTTAALWWLRQFVKGLNKEVCL